MPEIKVEDFCVARGSFTLGPLSLTINDGEVFAVLGRTGSGKSVLLEAMAGMFCGSSGRIMIDGKDTGLYDPSELSVGWLPQDHCLFPHMTVEENVEFPLRMLKVGKKERKEKAFDLMEKLGIADLAKRYPGSLSGGESQRTALARALSLRPGVLLMDEPFSALDPATREALYEEMDKIKREFRVTTVFVTHDFPEAVRLSDRTGILLGGKLRAVKKSSELLSGAYDEETEAFLGRRR